ncbi:hypothetical protein [Streptomyces sp. NPDC087856]|uniref:hypothetical protein n=1 Tax=Streptomyces sp. NPDC087856 TaxID=3365811 RepID=UPI003828D3B6
MSIVFDPSRWYTVTAQDTTEDCVNYGEQVTTDCWSNAGTVNLWCGLCGKRLEILAAVLVDPQPEIS